MEIFKNVTLIQRRIILLLQIFILFKIICQLINHINKIHFYCMQDTFARATHSARDDRVSCIQTLLMHLLMNRLKLKFRFIYRLIYCNEQF